MYGRFVVPLKAVQVDEILPSGHQKYLAMNDIPKITMKPINVQITSLKLVGSGSSPAKSIRSSHACGVGHGPCPQVLHSVAMIDGPPSKETGDAGQAKSQRRVKVRRCDDAGSQKVNLNLGHTSAPIP